MTRLASLAALAADLEAAGAALRLEPGAAPVGDEALLRAVDAVIQGSVRTLHPRFFNQNFAGADPIAVVGDWLGAALNTTMSTYEAAPVFTLVERALLGRLAALAGWPEHDGTMTPGGSMANLYGLHLARLRVDPEAAERGAAGGPRLCAFTSAHAHYSLPKAAALLGLGRRALRVVECDTAGRMRPDALAAAIADARGRGELPFFVNATAGTTVLGAFDPLPALADVCAREGLWLHVDGTFGASALLSPRQAWRMAGVERADSLAWNLHKMVGATQQCSAFLVRGTGLMRQAFAARAEYLFQPDKPNADLDTGDHTFLCGRRVDALKAWLVWRARGEAALAERIDHAVGLADACAARLAGDPRFALAAPPSWVNCCFWWVPPDLRPLDLGRADARERLHALAPAIKARMLAEGSTMIGYQPIAGGPNAFRLLFINPAVGEADVDAALGIVDRLGREVSGLMPGAPAPVLLARARHRRMRWKNGAGWTTEIARHPAGGEDFGWRVSVAEVDADADFSPFPGVDRTILVLDGAGMDLEVEGDAPARLVEGGPPHAFSGDRPARGRLVAGPTRDFNVMTRRGAFGQRVEVLPPGAPALLEREAGATWVVLAPEGGRSLGGVELAAGDAIRVDPGEGAPLRLVGGGRAILARIVEVEPGAGMEPARSA